MGTRMLSLLPCPRASRALYYPGEETRLVLWLLGHCFNTFRLFYSPKPRGQVRILIHRTRPFAACHSRGTKLPCWDAKIALGQDKQRKLPFEIMYAFCWSCPSAIFASQHGGFVPPDHEWQAAKGLLVYCL